MTDHAKLRVELSNREHKTKVSVDGKTLPCYAVHIGIERADQAPYIMLKVRLRDAELVVTEEVDEG